MKTQSQRFNPRGLEVAKWVGGMGNGGSCKNEQFLSMSWVDPKHFMYKS